MDKRRTCTKVIAIVLLAVCFLAAGSFLAWRLYNYFSFESIDINPMTAKESLQSESDNPFTYEEEDRVITATISNQTFHLFLRDVCTNKGVVDIQAVSSDEISFVYQKTEQERLLLFAHFTAEQSGNVIRFILSDLKLGTSKLGYDLSDLSRQINKLEFDFSEAIPSWTSLDQCVWGKDYAKIKLNVAFNGFRTILQPYLCVSSEVYLELSGKEEEFSRYLTDSYNVTVSKELAEDVLCGIFQEGEKREMLTALIATFSEEPYQKALSIFENHFLQMHLVEKIQQYRVSYKEKACEYVAGYYLDLLNEAFTSKTMHASVFYPYDATNGKIYDETWIAANMPQNLLYKAYCDARLYYDETLMHPAVMIRIPNEELVFYFDGESKQSLTMDELQNYPLWNAESNKAVRSEKLSDVSGLEDALEALRAHHRVEKISFRYMSQTRDELFVVFSMDDALALHGAYFQKKNDKWQLSEPEVGLYADFAKQHPEANYSLFPVEEYFGQGLSRVSNNDLVKLLDGLKRNGTIADDDYFVYYSCYNSYFYFESYLGKTGLVQMDKAVLVPSVFAKLLEESYD